MKSHHYLWGVVALILIALVVSSVSAAPAVANDARNNLGSPEPMYPGTEVTFEELNTQLKSLDYIDLQQLPKGAAVKEIAPDVVRWDVSLEELETNTAEYPDGYYGVSINKEKHSAIIAHLTTITLEDGQSARLVEFGVTRDCITLPIVILVVWLSVMAIGVITIIYQLYAKSTTSKYFTPMQRHTIYEGGYYYLSHKIYDQTLYDYLECEAPLLAENPGATLVINFRGRGWFNNNEIIAQTYSHPLNDKSQVLIYKGGEVYVYANQAKIGELLAEQRDLKWMGVAIPTSNQTVWYDVVWGSSYILPRR
jgi:hypothetical protein